MTSKRSKAMANFFFGRLPDDAGEVDVCLLLADGTNARGDVISAGWAGGSASKVGAIFSSGGTGTLRASARALVMAAALEKRALGSLAILFRMTAETLGEMAGLRRAGDWGIS